MTDYKTLSLEEYRALLTDCPRPTDNQIDAYIEYFVEVHSWYKHLPLLPKRRAFSFYLSPTAGHCITEDMDNNITVSKIKAGGSDMSTAYFQKYYANLSFTSAMRSTDSITNNKKMCLVEHFRQPHFYTLAGTAYCLPTEILEAGYVRLDRLIHPSSPQESWIGDLLEENIEWSDEIANPVLLEKVRNRLKFIAKNNIINYSPDPELLILVKPIIKSYMAEIKTAMHQMRDLIDN